MVRVLGYALALWCVGVLSGCSGTVLNGRPARSINREALIERIEQDPRFHVEDLVLSYHDAAQTEAGRKLIRNRVIDIGVLTTDQHYSLFLDKFTSSRKGMDTFTDLGALAADAMATLMTPASTKSIFAAISGGFTASNATFNKNYFYEQTLTAIIKQMESQRRVVLRDLLDGVTRSTTAYPLAAAMSDLERYYFAGTIDGAVSTIQQAAAEREQDASIEILQKRAAADLQKTLEGVSTADQWVKENGIASARQAVAAWYKKVQASEDVVKKRVTRDSVLVKAADQMLPEDLVKLVAEGSRDGAKQVFAGAGSNRATAVAKFINDFGDDFDAGKYLSEVIDAGRLAQVVGSFHEEIILKPGS